MAFWGVEVKPGKPFTLKFDEAKGRLHMSIATLGFGSETSKSILQCNVGSKSPVYLCSLYPGSSESLQLNLEFEEAEDVVLSVIGPRSIHLSGYYLRGRSFGLNDDETESYGEDIANTETERSLCSDEDEYEDSFINDGVVEVLPQSPISSGEEKASTQIKPKREKGSRRRLVRKSLVIESDEEECPEQKMVIDASKNEQIEESDENRCPISSLCKNRLGVGVTQLELGSKDGKWNNGSDRNNKAVKSKTKVTQPNSNAYDSLSDSLQERLSFENGEKTMENKEEGKVIEKILHEINADSTNVVEMVTPKQTEVHASDLVTVLPSENERNQNKVELQDTNSFLNAELGLQMKRNTKKKKKERAKAASALEGDAAAENNVAREDKSQENVPMPDDMTLNPTEDDVGKQKIINENGFEVADIVSHPSAVMGYETNENTKKKRKRKEQEKTIAPSEGDVASQKDVSTVDKSRENGANADDVAVNLAEDGEEKYKAIYVEKADPRDLPLSDGKTTDYKESKKKKKKHKTIENVKTVDKDITNLLAEQKAISMEEDENKIADAGPSKVGSSSSDLIIEEIEAGKQNSKIAKSGRKISIYYTGRFQSNGEIFDSNVGDAPYKFRLGRNKVIKGWDAGVEGMQVGQKRKLTVPPFMGFGAEGDGENIPPNAWLVYEIELVKVH